MEKSVVLSEKSKITIGLCITVLSLAFSMGIAWAQISELKDKITVIESIDRRLSRIEGKLGVDE